MSGLGWLLLGLFFLIAVLGLLSCLALVGREDKVERDYEKSWPKLPR